MSGYVGISALVALFLWFRNPKASTASLPPGPAPFPLLGNIADLKAKELWIPATRWAKLFGDIVYIHVLGQGIVFINSPDVAFDLLDKRGAIYSDKPQTVMVGELCGCKNMVAFTSYGPQSKRQRKLMHRALSPQSIPSYHPLLEIETNLFLQKLVADPLGYAAHTRRYAGGLTLSVIYGYQAANNDDPFLTLAEECVDLLANRIASGGGIWPVDIFPSLKHLPAWCPGARFKRDSIIWKAKMEEFVDKPYEFVKNSMSTGVYKPSFCSMLLADHSSKASVDFEFDLKWTANSMYGASIDTTITTISHFLLAMMEYPEVLAKAQEEIDNVVGLDRLPTFNDRLSLPYIECILSETWRWGVPVPLSLPHRLMEDDVYRDMFIPKGSLILGNIWAMMHDEMIFPDPYVFNPSRYLVPVDEATQKRRDPRKLVFGFGRRSCPGLHLVDSSVWLLMASMIATLNISKPIDDSGKVIEPKVVFENFIFRMPNHFKCDIRPRSEKALRLIRQSNGI